MTTESVWYLPFSEDEVSGACGPFCKLGTDEAEVELLTGPICAFRSHEFRCDCVDKCIITTFHNNASSFSVEQILLFLSTLPRVMVSRKL